MDDPHSAVVVMAVWGLCVGGISVATQAFIVSEASDVLEEATALNSAGFNSAIAIGALLGGLILDAAGLTPMILTSVLMVGAGAVLAGHYLRTSRDSEPVEPLSR